MIDDEDTGQIPGINLEKPYVRQLPRNGPVAVIAVGVAAAVVAIAIAFSDFDAMSVPLAVVVLALLFVGVAVAAYGIVWLRDVSTHEVWRPTVIKMGKAADALPQIYKLLKEIPRLLERVFELLQKIDPAAIGQIAATIQQLVTRSGEQEADRCRREMILRELIEEGHKDMRDDLAAMKIELADVVRGIVREELKRADAQAYVDALNGVSPNGDGGRVVHMPRKPHDPR
jgi:hypothetical protein